MIKIRECCGNQKEGDISRRPVIINHDLRGCSTEEELDKVSGLDAYSGRVLGISHREDIIQFSPILKPNYDWVRDHFRRIGLKCSENIIWDKDFDVLKDYGDYDFSVFYFGEKIHGIRPDEKWFSIADRMNEKNFFIKKSRELGLPTPKTFLFNSVEEINDLHVFPFPCYFKLSRSVSGMGVHKCAHFLELAEQLAKIKPGVRFQIQEKADSDCFISSQYRVTGGQLYFVATTAQILKGDVHKGNYGPIEYDPRNVTDVLAQFIFGLILSPFFELNRNFIRKLRTIGFALITPFFFIKGGMLVGFNDLITNISLILILLAIKVISKIIGVYPIARMMLPRGGRVFLTLLMSTGLTFGTISSIFGLQAGYISKTQFTILIAVVILSAVVPTIIAQRYWAPASPELKDEISEKGEQD